MHKRKCGVHPLTLGLLEWGTLHTTNTKHQYYTAVNILLPQDLLKYLNTRTLTVGTFEAENFREFRGFVAIRKFFSTKFGMWCFQVSQVNNPQKFYLQNSYFHQFVKVLSAKMVYPPTYKSFLPQWFSTIRYLVSMATFSHLHLKELLADQDLLNGLFMSSKYGRRH